MTAAAIAVSILFWLGGLTRVPSAFRSPSRRPLCVALLAFAVALTFDIPPVYTGFDHAVGVPNLADLIEHSFAIVGVFALLRTLEQLTNSPSRRRSRILHRRYRRVGVAVQRGVAEPRGQRFHRSLRTEPVDHGVLGDHHRVLCGNPY